MSGEHILGHISWSPDFQGDKSAVPNQFLTEDLIHLLDNGTFVFDRKPAPVEPTVNLTEEVSEPEREAETILGNGFPNDARPIEFTYTNWKGETATRRAIFSLLQWGSNEWHPEPQLLVCGYDLDKKAPRTYALKDMSDFKMIERY